ncbi:hypothetical protein MOP89_14665 [Enterococcus gallinarum]|nr:hypothetical protein [Enterococcus gallinarum]
MVQTRERLNAAQQLLCTNSINQLSAAMHNFQILQHIDGREERGRQAIAEQLMDVEEYLQIVKNQIQTIRNLYKEV